MMKKIFTILLLMSTGACFAQQYNNEWINFSQTYYKFKIGATGLYRISQPVLSSAGLGSAQAQYLQLWRNGNQVPVYSTVTTGTLGPSDYLEFWAEANDGKPDKVMYRDTAYQHTDKISLQTDTATYFLTVATTISNYQINQVPNNVAGNTLPLEPYFMYTDGKYFRDKLNWGFAAVVGEYVYSSSYDKGEFFSTTDIYGGTNIVDTKNLFLFPTGPNASLTYGAMGNALNPRFLRIAVNGTQLVDTIMDYFNDIRSSVSVPLALINSGTANIKYSNGSATGADRMVISFSELTYPRLFNFGGQRNFPFELPARSQGYYLEISNFNNGSTAPVLYDLTNNVRLAGDISVPGLVRFVVPGSSVNSKLVLVNEEAANIGTVASLTSRNFINFSDTTTHGNYLIISNPILYNGANGTNPVDEYKNYRRSANGGSFNVKIYDINQLVDQFAFGIKKHPLSIKNFLRFARAHFSVQPSFVFLIGRGVNYYEYRANESDPMAETLNLIPTFGNPASDNKLSTDDAITSVPITPIGRLSVVSTQEIEDYLEKVKEYESNQRTAPQTIAARQWMKNVMHITGASDPYLGTVLCNYMNAYKDIIEDTLVGAKVYTFCKSSASPVEQLSNDKVAQLFEEGLSILTYFGHSSSTTLDFNIDNPENYNNPGKYPMFFVNGCNAGNFFTFDPQRFTYNQTLSEKYTLAKQRGGIAFVASTHFGIVNYLNVFVNSLYTMLDRDDYGKSLGQITKDANQRMINIAGIDDYYARTHAEELTLHGDPSLKFNFQSLPDYVVEEPQILISPTFISIAETNFQVKAKILNLGKAIPDSISIEVKRQFPDGTITSIYKTKIPGIRYSDSLLLSVPIVGTRDKGLNKIIVTADVDNSVVEMSETNNTAVKDVFIYEDEARPVYPYNYAIINNPNQKLYASTANPFSNLKDYVLEVDTTKLFNSPFKKTKNLSSVGGVLEFDPGISYLDSTVYYWRIAFVPSAGGQYRWNYASFMYKSGAGTGFNQSHLYQHLESTFERISLDSNSRVWSFGTRANEVIARAGVFPTAANQADHYAITINGTTNIRSVCGISGIIFNVFNPVTIQPLLNAYPGNPSQYGSDPVCGLNRIYSFQYNILDTNKRRKIVEFLDAIPDGYYVIVRNISGTDSASNTYASTWRGDTSYLGSNTSMYHRLLNQGFTTIDSFFKPRAFIFAYKKNRQSEFTPKTKISDGIYDRIQVNFDVTSPDTIGFVTSPVFGPARNWQQLRWLGTSTEAISTDSVNLDIIGVDNAGNETKLYSISQATPVFDLSSVRATQYPFLKLKMTVLDTVNLTPYQLKYWRIYYDPVPEGAIAPNIFYSFKDTLDIGEKLNFGIAFKNISQTAFDSLKIKMYVLDKNNVSHFVNLPRTKPLITGDTVKLMYQLDTKPYPGLNTLYVDFNPDNDQLEQYHFNNFMFRNFYVKSDLKNPLLDVTFDGVHILNRDIVSAKPHILIKLKDESKYLLLDDTSLITVQVRYPDKSNTLKTFHFNSDTMKFIPAVSGSDNSASIELGPYFPQIMDNGQPLNPGGDEYELIVKGKDKSGNKAGNIEFRITFKVINKPMISNLLNYPNPFTTSTAFVFTITGSDVPQNMKIQILTITGKIIREITKEELGPLHIGRNITDFKWDGTDQYGQKVGNGVYLYRFVTTLNGKAMEKYKSDNEDTDRFFIHGYGKMYLMR